MTRQSNSLKRGPFQDPRLTYLRSIGRLQKRIQTASSPIFQVSGTANETLREVPKNASGPDATSSDEEATYGDRHSSIIYHVPRTTVVVYVDLQNYPIERGLLVNTIHAASTTVRQHIAEHGDGRVLDGHIVIHPYPQCFLYAQSNPVPGPQGRMRHLTWGVLGSAIDGLFYALILRRNFRAATWRVSTIDLGMVGLGTLSVPLPPPPQTLPIAER